MSKLYREREKLKHLIRQWVYQNGWIESELPNKRLKEMDFPIERLNDDIQRLIDKWVHDFLSTKAKESQNANKK